jgi:hypothetical protein
MSTCKVCAVSGNVSKETLAGPPALFWFGDHYYDTQFRFGAYYCRSHFPGTSAELAELSPQASTLASTTRDFDTALEELITARGKTYGHPLDTFGRIAKFAEVIQLCPDPEIRHALHMISVKIARLVTTPSHFDSILDIAGYARTMVMILDERERRNLKETES